jgi:putative dehydrogenase
MADQRVPVGIIGVGNMGGAIVQRLLSLGWSVAVRDIDAAREAQAAALGAQVRDSPRALALACDALIVTVVDAAQTDAVLFGPDGAAAALRPGAMVLLCPTIAPADAEHFAQRLNELGIDAIDAPMSGGPERARNGTMSLMVACAEAAFERRRELIEAIADPVLRIGSRVGDGARVKLVNNLLAGINLAGAAEALALAERLGLDAAFTLSVIERSSGASWIGSDRLRRALAGDRAPRAATALLDKDTHLALAMAAKAGVVVPLGALAAEQFARACAAGYAAQDDASLFTLLRPTLPPAPPEIAA